MGMRRMKFPSVVFLLMLMAGCAALSRVEMGQDAMAAIRSIDVVVPPEPDTYVVSMENHPGSAVGGAIGGLIVAADQTSKANRLKEAMRTQHISVHATVASSLAQTLRAAGYRTRVVDGQWDRAIPPGINLETINSDADAILVVAPRTVGFVAAGALSPYEPTVNIEVTLLGRDRKTVVYRGLHSEGRQPLLGDWRHRAARRTFADMDSLVRDPGAAALALTDAGVDVAESVASDMRLVGSPPPAARHGT